MKPTASYLLSVAAVAVAFVARWLFDSWLGDHLPFVTFFVAVAVASWLGGLRHALLATALGFVLAWYFFVPVRFSFEVQDTAHAFGLVMYLMVCLGFAGFGEAMLLAQHRAEMRREALRVTLASIGDAVITTDLEGRITYLNSVAEALTGWTDKDAVGQPLDSVFRIINEETRKPAENPATRALREGAIVALANHTLLIRKDGTQRPIDDSAAPIKNEHGHVAGCVLVFRDIAQRRQLEHENAQRLAAARQLAAIIESSEDAIVSKSLDGTIWTWNAAAQRLFGYSDEQAVGQNISLLFPADRADEEPLIVARLRAGERVEHFDTVRVRSNGQPIHVSLTISPIRDEAGQVIGASKIVRDITDRKQSEERIYGLLADLKNADRRKDEFLAMLAHELRGPLAPLRNMLEVMKRAEGNGELLQQALSTMERQLGSLVRFVDDLLDLSRITHDNLELRKQRVELASIIHQAVETCRPIAEASKHEVKLTLPHEPIYLHADATRLAQAFGNLLHNACKYTPPKGHIWLTAERQGSDVVVNVKDTGVGIPPDKLDSIFEMFTQVDQSLERSHDGLGIGLTLVRRLIQLHDGTVTAQSKGTGRGSEFIVRLPIPVIPHEEYPRQPPPEPLSTTPRRVLIVDDNPDAATSLAMLLKITGNATETATDGRQAVQRAATYRPEIILLDIGLPKMSGYEVCRAIREQSWGKDIVIVALTGWGQDEDRRKSKEAGFDEHLVKPVDYNVLLRLLADSPAAKATS